MTTYFSDKEAGLKPRTEEKISPTAWGGIVALIQALISTGAFGFKYPEMCSDGQGPIGTDGMAFSMALKAEVPNIEWPLKTTKQEDDTYFSKKELYVPEALVVLDLIQFCYQSVAKPKRESYHKFFSHHHLTFDEEVGKEEFVDKINTIFARNGVAYQLLQDGSIERIAPPIIKEALVSTAFHTGDITLNGMLEESKKKFLSPNPNIRREAVERLWDCWERIKSIEDPNDKKMSIKLLLDKASSQVDIRNMLEKEARELTQIGNSFHIRHTEVTQTIVIDSYVLDYLFHRLFAMIHMLLKK